MPKQIMGSTDVENWRSQQIAGILVILFFGTIAISYIIFVNTYIFRKNNSGSLLDSQWFKIPMFGMVVLSTIIIFNVMNNSNDTQGNTSIVIVLIVLNIIIFFKYLQIPILKIEGLGDCLDSFFGYNYYKNGTTTNCQLTILNPPFGLNEPLASYISPILFIIFASISSSQQNFNKVLFGSFSFIIAAEYILFKRWNLIIKIFQQVYSLLFNR